MRKLIIDTDPGIDDAMAVLLAACHPSISLVGLSSIFGNVPVEIATCNALALAELAGLDIPVAAGAARPLVQAPHPYPDYVHGAGGFGTAKLPQPVRAADPRGAATFLAEAAAENPGEITICAIGPLTNLASALHTHPGIAGNVAGVVVMGGAVWTGGNVTPAAEANIWQDPHAAAEVLAANWPVTLVGLDVTEQVRCTPQDFDTIADGAPMTGGFLRAAVEFYFAFHRETAGFTGCYMHDPTAVLTISAPHLFKAEELPIEVVTDGAEAGRTRIGTGTGGHRVRVCREVAAEAVRSEFVNLMKQGDACRRSRSG